MNNAIESMPKQAGRRRGLLWLQIFFVLGFLIVLGAAWFSNLPTKPRGVPEQVAGLYLVGSVTGAEALEQISQLHGKEIVLVDGYLATYAREGERIKVWVGVASSSDSAAQLLELMTSKIGEGRSPFRNLRETTVSGQRVFSAEGMGQSHFYYQSEDKVIWLSVERGEPLSLLNRSIKIF